MIDTKSSQIISLLKTYSIIGIAFIHAPKIIESPFFDLISKHIPSSCVPIFFMISGLLLFQKPVEKLEVAYIEIKKRVRTLLIPFLFWNLLILTLSIIAIKLAPAISNGGPYTVTDFSPFSIASAIFGINRHPINYQFWFIRNLMLLVVLSPVFKQLSKGSPWIGLALALAIDQVVTGGLFFYLGGLLSTHANTTKTLTTLNIKWTIGLALCIFATSLFHPIPYSILLCASFSLMIGASNIEVCNTFLASYINSLSSCVFFIYATHEPVITVLERLFRKIPASSLAFKHFEFVMLPLISILITWIAALIAKRYVSKLYSIATGSR